MRASGARPSKWLLALWVLGQALSSAAAESSRAQELIEALQLRPLNVESGLFAVVHVSDLEVIAPDGVSAASNLIYLMLSQSHPQNHVQWLSSDDNQILIEGGPADYYLFYADGRAEKITMGRDLAAGQQMMVVSPGGTAKAIVLHEEAEFLLVGSMLSPAWSPQRVRIGGDQAFVDRYTQAADWATPAFIRSLIGPNFGSYVGSQAQGLEVTLDVSGQIIWQEMQLTEQQFLNQLRKLRREDPAAPIRVTAAPGAPEPLVARMQALLLDAGVQAPITRP